MNEISTEVLKLASDHRTPPAILRQLIKSKPSLAVKVAIRKHPNCPPSLFQELGKQLEKVLPYEALSIKKGGICNG
ncbi:hypothetical protein KJ564_02365 [bacterium]|nr:hypothetical protein [bacterium]